MRVDQAAQTSTMEDTKSGVPADAVGRRVACDGERGTVLFVGTVPPTAGLWLGVEWDNHERGKHNGSHEGVQYFTCRHPTGGSFVRPKKASFGVDYLAALQERYEADVQEVMEAQHSFSTISKTSTKTLEMVGMERISKQQRMESLTTVALRRCEVCGPGPENEIRDNTPDVLSLDLCGNLLCCWEGVASITQQMEHLEELLLNYNRLRVTSDLSAQRHAFSCLKVLSLTNCALTWPQLLECAPMWPRLEELYVSDNEITELQRPQAVLQSLSLLDLSNNRLAEDGVLSLGDLPRLENLNLSNTGLSVLCFDDVAPGSETTKFPALTILSLKNNNISDWRVVNELGKLRSLTHLSCRYNPLVARDGNPKTTRELLIAKLARLVSLDLSQLQPEDRRGAELDYIKMFGEEWLKAGGHGDPQQNRPNADFTLEHPHYQTLIQKYGAAEEGEFKKQQPFALKNQLLSITFVCPDETDRKPVIKKLPDSMIVQKVKGLLYRLLKIPGTELKLTYSSSKMEGKEVDIDNDLKQLKFYSIEDGDKVLVRWS